MPGSYKNSNNSNNVLTLVDYLSMCSSDNQRQKLFFSMDLSMKKLHDNKQYVKNFSPDSILVHEDNNDFSIYYQSISSDSDSFYRKQNIFYLACFAIGVYSGCLEYINPKKPEFLIDNFSEFAQFVPSGDVPYYKGIIVRGASVYYSDFITAKRNQEISSVQSIQNFNSNNASGGALIKSTLIGRMNAKEDYDQSAFINILLFPLIMIIGFVISFLIILFS